MDLGLPKPGDRSFFESIQRRKALVRLSGFIDKAVPPG
jgi:hypothetical protein